jgi:lipoprotein LprG
MTTTTSPRPRRPRLVVALVIATGLASLQACTDDSGGGGSAGVEDTMAAAKQQLDETSGVDIALTTDKLPEGVEGILSAVGTGTKAPAFEGDLKVRVNNLTAEVPVVSVDGAVWAKLPFSTQFVEVDPADYAAPDPAELMAPEGGISSWLTEAEGVEEGEQVRSGDRVLTSYTGTLPGKSVAAVIPSADSGSEFDVEFRLDEDDKLVDAVLTGPFYGKKGEVTYDLELSGYGTSEDITAPTGQ